MKYFWIVGFCVAFAGCSSCARQQTTPLVSQPEDSIEEQLIARNRENQARSKAEIEAFVKEKGWPMQTTGTGLKIYVYENTEGLQPKMFDKIRLNYAVTLLDGTPCYATEEGQPESFKIGKSAVETGLHEGIMLMKEGEKAKMILPPHLAHGLTGDQNKIPLNASIVYDVELLQIME